MIVNEHVCMVFLSESTNMALISSYLVSEEVVSLAKDKRAEACSVH